MAEYLRVRNWEKFQHYKTGKNAEGPPSWIRLHRSVLRDYEFSELTMTEKGQLMLIWLLAAEKDNKIPNDPLWIQRHIDSEEGVDVDKLVSLRFLEPYDNPRTEPGSVLGQRRVEKSREEREKRREEKKNLNFNDYESGDRNLMVSPPRSLATALGSLNGRVAAKEAEDAEDVAQTLNGFFPPQRIGAGSNPAVVRWLGRIKEQDIAHALNYFRAQTYRVDGEERTWGQLTEDHCQRVITAGLNAILKERS